MCTVRTVIFKIYQNPLEIKDVAYTIGAVTPHEWVVTSMISSKKTTRDYLVAKVILQVMS